MSKSKTPSLPATPTFQSDPNYTQGINRMSSLGNRLTSFDFTGDLAPLADTINVDPEVTRLALQYAQQSLTPAWGDTVKSIRNEAANAGALESSTFTDALTQASSNLQSQYQSIVTGAALEDRSNAMNNRMNLFGTGLNTISSATGLASQNQGQMNDFNLRNYENLVAKSQSEQKAQKGGLMGGLMGGAGGAALGLALAPFTGGASLLLVGGGAALGGAAGAMGPQGTGESILGMGSSLAGGLGGLSQGTAVRPGSTAGALSSQPYQPLSGSLSRNPYLGFQY